VHHHRGVDAGEGAALEHEDLAAAAFLGGGAEHSHGDPEVVGERRQRERRRDRSGRDHVVPAGMSDAGQGVVLRTDAEDQRPAAHRRTQRGRQVGDPALHGEAGRGELVTHPGAGALLLEADLGVGVQPVRQGDHLVPGALDGRAGGGPGLDAHACTVGRRAFAGGRVRWRRSSATAADPSSSKAGRAGGPPVKARVRAG